MSSAKSKTRSRGHPASRRRRKAAVQPTIETASQPEAALAALLREAAGEPQSAAEAEAPEATLDVVWLETEAVAADATPHVAPDVPGTTTRAEASENAENESDTPAVPGLAPAAEDPNEATDIFGLMRQLDQNFAKGWVAADDPANNKAKAEKKSWNLKLPSWWMRAVKSVLGLLVIVVVGWQPFHRLFQTSSVEAVVNARLVTLRAPINGVVGATPERLIAGTSLEAEQTLFSITDPVADRGRLVELENASTAAEDERRVAADQLAQLQQQHQRLQLQVTRFREGRARQLEAQLQAYDADIAAAKAQRETAEAALDRALALGRKNAIPAARVDDTKRDLRVAESNVRALAARRRMTTVEIEALEKGTFIGDSYNDRPSSAQRDDEVLQQIATLEAKLAGLDLRRARLATELVAERERTDRLTRYTLKAPVDGAVWETLVSPGETVARGQDILRLLDCSGAVVTATVSESVYNRLRIGTKALFIPADKSVELEGKIVQLTGVASPASNLAIEPSALVKEYYRVVVSVPGLAKAGSCHVGRTGRIVFGG